MKSAWHFAIDVGRNRDGFGTTHEVSGVGSYPLVYALRVEHEVALGD